MSAQQLTEKKTYLVRYLSKAGKGGDATTFRYTEIQAKNIEQAKLKAEMLMDDKDCFTYDVIDPIVLHSVTAGVKA